MLINTALVFTLDPGFCHEVRVLSLNGFEGWSLSFPPFRLPVVVPLLVTMPFARQLPITDISRIPSRMRRAVNTAPVPGEAGQEANQWWFSSLCLAGSMSDRVFIKVSADAGSGKVKVEVYCDNALLPSKLTGPIKRALEGHRR